MTILRWSFVALAAIVVMGYGVHLSLFPSVTLRYRLTVDVEVDGAIHSGAGVVEISYNPVPWLPVGGNGFPGRLYRGYAITIDLGARGLLFIVDAPPVLENPNARRGLSNTWSLYPNARSISELPLALYKRYGTRTEMLGLVRHVRSNRNVVDVPPDFLPMLIRFRDLNNRNSNEELDPNNLAPALGDGARFVKATLQITDDSITPMPGNWPSWLTNASGQDGFLVSAYRGDTHGTFWCSSVMFKGG